MDIDTGNAHDVDTRGTGWFVGFSEWSRSSVDGLRFIPPGQDVRGLCIKWFHHPAGHESGPKPVSEGRTVSVLVTDGGHFEIEFCETEDFERDVRTVVLRREGDFAVWGARLFHRWRCIAAATIATVRWTEA